jgi:hypothetical protein
MIGFESYTGSSFTQNVHDHNRTGREVVRDYIATTFPDIDDRAAKDVVSHANDLFKEANESGESDSVGLLVLCAGAVAVALQGRTTITGKLRNDIVRKSPQVENYWGQFVKKKKINTSLPPPVAVQTNRFKIRSDFIEEVDEEIYDLSRDYIDELSSTLGLFPHAAPNVAKIYRVSADAQKAEELKKRLHKAGHIDDSNTSYYLDGNKVVLGRTTGINIYRNDAAGDLARGTLVHEIAHGFTDDQYSYRIQGRLRYARILSEMLAEHARAFIGFPSESYLDERGLQFSINDIAGLDIIGNTIDEYYTNDWYADKNMLNLYARNLVSSIGLVSAGLVVQAHPEIYMTPEYNPINISLLGNGLGGRYGITAEYVSQNHRYKLDSYEKARETVWSPMPTFEEESRRRMSSLARGMRRTVKVFA